MGFRIIALFFWISFCASFWESFASEKEITASQPLWIEELEFPTHSFFINVVEDSSGGTGQELGLDYGFLNGVRLLVGLSQSSFDPEVSSEKIRSHRLGFSTDPLDQFYMGAEIETWGIPDVLIMRGGLVNLGGDFGNWNYKLSPGVRRYIFSFSNQVDREDFVVKATSLSGALTYSFSEGVWIQLSGQRNNFDVDLARANQALLRGIFVKGARELGYSVESSVSTLELGLDRDGWSASIFVGKRTSALDGAESTDRGLELFVQWTQFLGNTFSVTQSIGSEGDIQKTVGVGLTMSWN